MCRAHGVPGRFLPQLWVNAQIVPRFYPNAVTLTHGEAVLGLLNPETKAFGYFANLVMAQTRGMIPGTPLPLDQSLLLIWPQITGLIAGMIVLFAIAYIVFQREEVRA